ncbi:phosphoglycerate kinase [Candidatus Pacearchaeota archaeon]|nr:phosphoglycerate kinase [Candidatus Pacearchaeota archaeon]
MKTLNDFNFKGKTVIVRSDLNSDIKNGKVLMSKRIKESSVTIKELKNKGAKIVIIAHQGRKGKVDCISLRQHAKLLSKFTKVKFVDDIIGKGAELEVSKLKNGEAVLLENIRFLDKEMKPGKNSFVKFFIGKIDIYVNDAFSVCHRKQTSIVTFPKYFKHCMGRVLQKEVEALEKINLKDCLYILGGAKPKDNIKLLKKNRVLATGFFGQLCLIAKGIKFGEYENFLKDLLKDEFNVHKKLKKKLDNVIVPIDYAIKINGKRKEILVEDFPNKHIIYDIGKMTMNRFSDEIKKAKAIYMKGPSGDCRESQFSKGTISILNEVSKSSGFTLIGGGHLNDAIDKSKIPRNKFNHISLSGGALLSYLSGEKLPGLKALK